MLPTRQATSIVSLHTSPIASSTEIGASLTRRFCKALLVRESSARLGAEWLAYPEPSCQNTELLSHLLNFTRTVLTEPLSLCIRDDSLLLFENRVHMSLSVHRDLSNEAKICLQELLQHETFEVLLARKPHRIFANRFKYNAVFEQSFDRVEVVNCTFRAMLRSMRMRRNTLCDALDGALNMLLRKVGEWPDLKTVRVTINGFRA